LSENEARLRENISQAARAFSGSWLGYHANVYYRNLEPPEPGDHFSPEWGLMLSHRTSGNWHEYAREDILAVLMSGVADDYEEKFTAVSEQAKAVLQEHLDAARTIVEVLLKHDKTQTLQRLHDELNDIQAEYKPHGLIDVMRPSGTIMSRDTTAMTQGFITPVHCTVQAEQIALLHPFTALEKLIDCCRRVRKYMEINDLMERKSMPSGSKIFIGHGRAPLWRELKDFLHDRLHLEWEEFNRSPAAGVATTERLQEMLDASSFAFLAMTAEDQHADETLHARENVVHEVGLFQGHLGFRRAIVLLEEGCAEFSNIIGLTQVRFPAGNISACFEDLRRILEREGLL